MRRPAVAVHRARRRLQPRPDRARQRDDQRDHARPHAPARRASASTTSSRSPSSRSSSTCKLKNYSSGMHRAARVLGRDPGRRRGAADRRGARRRRRRLPAEVLRRVPAAQATRAARSSSSRTTWARSSASATARCCSSRGKMVDIGEPHAIARRYNELNFGRTVHAAGRAGADGALRRPARRRSSTRWFEDAAGERIADARPRRALPRLHARCASTSRSSDPIFGFTLRNEVGATVFATHHRPDASARPARFEAGERGRRALRVRELARRRAATRSRPSIARARARRRRDRPARGHRVS